MITSIQTAMHNGLTQKRSCELFGIDARKFRRWKQPKAPVVHTAWNKILDHERDAIVQTAWDVRFAGKPLSHLYVHGHETNAFSVSLSTVYRVLKKEDVIRKTVRRRKTGYVSAHTLLDEGFSLLCYDATRFVTETNMAVWALPVILLPSRYLLHIGYALGSVTAKNLTDTLNEAYAALPESSLVNLIAHSDRGSAMKARRTKEFIDSMLGAPVHFGRPHTPDDEAWIEAFIRTLKYHRDVPVSFPQVDDVVCWLKAFPTLYNNDPHSSHKYVTPLQVLLGQKEVILEKRKRNLLAARLIRYTTWKSQQQNAIIRQPQKEVALLS